MSQEKLKKYVFKERIGKGNFAKVWKAIDTTEKNFVAIKIMDDNQIKSQPKVLELLKSEIHILKTIDNQNVLKLYDSFIEKGRYYLVLEYCNGGDLENYVKSKPNQCISEEEALGFLKQLLSGFKGLHEIKVLHRDFKLANVLIHDGVLKIADLGFSKQADLAKTALGTAVYMAPEIMKYYKYSNKVDIWSLGISLYEMLFGGFPFFGKNEPELLKNIELNKIDFNAKGKKISVELQHLIQNMLNIDPDKRINWIDIYNHQVLNPQQKEIDGGLRGSVAIFMKKNDMEREHQNMVFQKNKDFYQDKKNLEYELNFEMKAQANKKENYEEKKKEDSSSDEEKTFQKNKHPVEKIPQKSNILAEPINQNLEKLLAQKKESLQFLENKYLHWRNIISQHARILNDGFTLITNDNAIYIYFILAKRILFLSKEFFDVLEKKTNYFNGNFFEDFAKSRSFEKIYTVFKEEKFIYEAYFESLKIDIQSYDTISNPLYEKLKVEFNNKITNIEELFKEILVDYLFNGQMVVIGYKNEKKIEKAKNFAVHLIELADCYKFKEVFKFDVNEEAGFNFERYRKMIEVNKVDELIKIVEQKIESILV